MHVEENTHLLCELLRAVRMPDVGSSGEVEMEIAAVAKAVGLPHLQVGDHLGIQAW